MQITTFERTLTANDFGGKSGHGGVVIPRDATLENALKNFFEGVQTQQEFIDVREQDKKYKLKYADYTSNGSTPNDRVTSINKYANHHSLEVCDTLIIEKIENGSDKTYLIDYVKKFQSIYLLGKKKDKATVPNSSKFTDVIKDAKSKGTVSEPVKNEFHFDAKYLNKKRAVVLNVDPQGLIETTIDGKPLGYTNRDSFEIDFGKSPIQIIKAQQDWTVFMNQPILFNKYNATPYDLQENEDRIVDEDIEAVSGIYSAKPESKKTLKVAKSGRKIYPRDKKISANALKRANHTCEYCPSHKSFLRKNKNIKYMEPHHLIPLHMHEEFDNSLDVEANIVSLCSNCHNQIHYGNGKDIVSKLWDLRNAELTTAGIDTTNTGIYISKNELLKIYGF